MISVFYVSQRIAFSDRCAGYNRVLKINGRYLTHAYRDVIPVIIGNIQKGMCYDSGSITLNFTHLSAERNPKIQKVLAPGEKGHSESGEKGQLPVG